MVEEDDNNGENDKACDIGTTKAGTPDGLASKTTSDERVGKIERKPTSSILAMLDDPSWNDQQSDNDSDKMDAACHQQSQQK